MIEIGLTRELIGLRVARALGGAKVVNLGIGLPTQVMNFVGELPGVVLHSENGILNYGAAALDAPFDRNLINAGGESIRLLPGASFCDSAASFALVRGGHIDVAVLGALQVSERGDLANWFVPERGGGSIGGAMDLATGARRVIVAMEHVTREGRPRLVHECSYPLTATQCVSLIVTELAVLEVHESGLVLTELAPGVALETVRERTEANVSVSPDLREMEL